MITTIVLCIIILGYFLIHLTIERRLKLIFMMLRELPKDVRLECMRCEREGRKE